MIKQEVILTVHDAGIGGKLILDASGLRVDFDVRKLPGYNRATATIYNLNEATVASLMSGDRFITIKTRLHGGKLYTLADRYYLSNTVDELNLPDRTTKLYMFDSPKKDILEKQINISVRQPSLSNCVKQVYAAGGGTGTAVFSSFPKDEHLKIPPRGRRVFNGSVENVFSSLAEEFKFVQYNMDGAGIAIMYKPDSGEDAELNSEQPTIVLQTDAMKSNPKIGIASASIVSNLDPRIVPTSVIDLSQLLTIGVDATEQTLRIADVPGGYLKNFSSSKYQAFTVVHTGSNYTASWDTTITARSPTKGKLMSTVQWANINKGV